MGVLTRLFRRSRTTDEALSAEPEIPQPTATATVTATAGATDAAAAAAEGTAEAGPRPRPAAGETTRPTADEGAGIPKQQSAKDVADSEADESARA